MTDTSSSPTDVIAPPTFDAIPLPPEVRRAVDEMGFPAAGSQTTAPLEQMTIPLWPSCSSSGYSQRGGRPSRRCRRAPRGRGCGRRHALSKLVNSLSNEIKVVAPVPIDENQLVFRIDIRDYDWDAPGKVLDPETGAISESFKDTWELIAAKDQPFAPQRGMIRRMAIAEANRPIAPREVQTVSFGKPGEALRQRMNHIGKVIGTLSGTGGDALGREARTGPEGDRLSCRLFLHVQRQHPGV